MLLILIGCAKQQNDTPVIDLYLSDGKKASISIGKTSLNNLKEILGAPERQEEWASGTVPVEWSVAQAYYYDKLSLRIILADWKLSIDRLFPEGVRRQCQVLHTEDSRVSFQGVKIGDSLKTVLERFGEGTWYAEAIGNRWWVQFDKKQARFAFDRDVRNPRFPRSLAQPEVVRAIEIFTPETLKNFPSFSEDEWRVPEDKGKLSAKDVRIGDDLKLVFQRCGEQGQWSLAGMACWKYSVEIEGKLVEFFFRRDLRVAEQPMALLPPKVVVGLSIP